MKVTSAETWILRLPFVRESRDFEDSHHDLAGVTLHSDEGETGLGFSFLPDHGGGTAVTALMNDVLLPRVVGRDVAETTAIWSELRAVTHRMGSGINSFAIAAIDTALWDLRARAHGHSLAVEIGQIHSSVPGYGSGKGSPLLEIGELIELQAGYAEMGFDAVKIRVGIDPNEDVRRVAALRGALGDDVGIMCDANERLDVLRAIRLGHRLADHGILWLEEPLPSGHVSAHVRLRQNLPMAIAAGEHLCSVAEFAGYVDAGAIDVLQPNIGMVGGVTEILKIGALAESHGLGFAPHLFGELHVHIAAALEHPSYVEYFPWIDKYVEEPLEVRDGRILVPEGPGHGVRFRRETWERFRVQ